MKKSDNLSFPYLQKEDFHFHQFPLFLNSFFFSSFSFIGRTSLKNNAHTKDTHLHSIFLTLSLSCKANKQQHSTRKLRTQAAGRSGIRSPLPLHQNPPKFQGKKKPDPRPMAGQ